MSPDATAALLEEPRYELLPFMGIDDAVMEVPDGSTISITASPDKGLDLTIDTCVDIARETDLDVCPHLAARAVRDRDHLASAAERFHEVGITDVFVPGGDNATPEGPYEEAYEVLAELEEMGLAFDDVGITGYPEGHPIIDETALNAAMMRKAPHATYIVTQICFAPDPILTWVESIREEDVELPVYVGIPGVMRTDRMIGIARKVGVGESIKFVRKTTGLLDMVRRLIGNRGRYKPDALVDGLAPAATDDDYGIAGVHLYTFNEVAAAELWRRGRL